MVGEIIVGSAIGTVTARVVDKQMDKIKSFYAESDYRGADVLQGKAFANFDGEITWDSKPNHDDWGPDNWWSAADWIAWHNELVKKHGKEKADRIWANEYDKSSWSAAEINYAVKNEEFKKFLQANGLAEKSTILSKLFRAETSVNKVLEPFDKLYRGAGGLISGAGNALGNVGDAVDKGTNSLGNVLKWLPWIAAGAALVFAYFYFKPFSSVAKAAA